MATQFMVCELPLYTNIKYIISDTIEDAKLFYSEQMDCSLEYVRAAIIPNF